MDITYATPALLFPTVSLLYIGYTNRFLSIANLIRSLKQKWEETGDAGLIEQMDNLRRRLILIRNMQILGITALFMCMVSMLLIFTNHQSEAKMAFAVSMVLLLLSLLYSLREIQLSIVAIRIEINGVEELAKRKELGLLPDAKELLRRSD